jgi:histidinol-phosphate aminotransferase
MFESPQMPAAEVIAHLLQEAIIVRPAFGLDNHIRLSIGTPEQNSRFIAALAAVLQNE